MGGCLGTLLHMTTTSVQQPALTTGWEADVAPGDTVLRRFLLHLAESSASVAEASGAPEGTQAGVLRRPDVCVADTGRPAGFFNSVVLLQPPAAEAWPALLGDVEERLAGGSGDAFLWSAWPTPDLRPRGWQLMGHPPLLVRPPGGRLPPAPAGLRIAEVRDAAGLDDWARVATEGYPLTELVPYRPGTLLDARILADRRWRFWVGYDDGRPVACGTLFVSHGLAQLALGATRPGVRGRSYWYGLVRERLLAEPGLLSGGVFSDDSRPGVEALGYLPILRLTLWQLPRPV